MTSPPEPTPAIFALDHFHTAASDRKGHSGKLFLRIEPAYLELLATLVQSRAIPEYRTAQDVIRDAVHRWVTYLDSDTLARHTPSPEAFAHISAADAVSRRRNRQAFVDNLWELLETSNTTTEINELLTIARSADVCPEVVRVIERAEKKREQTAR